MSTYILTFSCPDGRGIIHAITGALLTVNANVLEQEQYSDPDSGLFFARTRFACDEPDVAVVRALTEKHLAAFNAKISIRREDAHRRVLILVSQHDHCLVDLLYRWENAELPIDIVGIVSNHETCRSIAERHGVPFTFVPVTSATKAEAEKQILDLVEANDVDLVVLARYMQVLTDDFCNALEGRIINIHHSFLPGFKGAKPYHQAHERGVKLIGATSHFVTAALDEGPIIEQEVRRVTHRETPEQLAEIGRDVERLVLARAVRLFAEDRIFVNDRGTVVFG